MNREAKSYREKPSRFVRPSILVGALAAIALVFLAVFRGCGNPSTIARLSECSIVVAFGDSLTAGTGASAAESYPSVLSELLGCRVVNAGVPGEKSSEALLRLPSVLEKEKPTLVILCEGGNDMLSKREDAGIREALDAMISLMRDAGADVILVGVPRPALRLQTAPFYQEVADKNGVPCDVETVAEILSTPSLKSDYAHPNADGYRKMAESIAALIHTRQR